MARRECEAAIAVRALDPGVPWDQSRWAPYVRIHGPGQGQFPKGSIRPRGYMAPGCHELRETKCNQVAKSPAAAAEQKKARRLAGLSSFSACSWPPPPAGPPPPRGAAFICGTPPPARGIAGAARGTVCARAFVGEPWPTVGCATCGMAAGPARRKIASLYALFPWAACGWAARAHWPGQHRGHDPSAHCAWAVARAPTGPWPQPHVPALLARRDPGSALLARPRSATPARGLRSSSIVASRVAARPMRAADRLMVIRVAKRSWDVQ